MIYTVTFNPSLDYVIGIEQLIPGEINRTTHENIYPGGKGVNVSVLLSNLGHKSKALGFVAGFTGKHLEEMLDDFGCYTDFIHLKQGMTRINVKINAGEETEINGQGPVITEEAVSLLLNKLDGMEKDDILVLAGSIPDTLPPDMYERIMGHLKEKQIRIAVDATRDLLLNVLKFKPFLIKPNNHELGDMFGVNLKTEEEIVHYAVKLQEKGARNVLVSMAGDGAILITEEGRIYKKEPPKGVVKNSVGAGDSMVAGFLTGYLNTGDYEKAFSLGIAAGSATAFRYWLAGRDDVAGLLEDSADIYGI